MKSVGITFTKRVNERAQSCRIDFATVEPVNCEMILDRLLQFDDVLVFSKRFEFHHFGVAALREYAVRIPHVRNASAHAGGEVATGFAQHDYTAAGHVFATMITDAFDNRVRAAVAHREALRRDTAEVRFTAGRTVEHDVADEDVAFSGE